MKPGRVQPYDWPEAGREEGRRLPPLVVTNLISLRIAAPSNGGFSADSPELRSALEGLEGILATSYDAEAGRIQIRFDPRRMTILKILNATESLGQQLGRPVRPADVQAVGWQHWEGSSPRVSGRA